VQAQLQEKPGAAVEQENALTIRRVSDLTGVPPHTLRFWERVMPHVLKPQRTAGGQRRYDRQAVECVLEIKRLSEVHGYSLAAIGRRLKAEVAFSSPPPSVSREVDIRSDLIDSIVLEITALLKERLLRFLQYSPSENEQEQTSYEP